MRQRSNPSSLPCDEPLPTGAARIGEALILAKPQLEAAVVGQ
jgi:hypothetical protein